MTKYPLDRKGIQNIVLDIQANDVAQKELIFRLTNLLSMAQPCVDDIEWNEKVDKLLLDISDRASAFENLRFDQGNGHRLEESFPEPPLPIPIQEPIQPPVDDQLTEEELAIHFREQLPLKKKVQGKSFDKMNLDEIEEWEAAQDNSNDIYKVSARVKNLARLAVKGNLTAQGTMVVNMFTHMIKNYYDFANTIPDKEIKMRLVELTKQQEDIPANLIAALGSGVKEKE